MHRSNLLYYIAMNIRALYCNRISLKENFQYIFLNSYYLGICKVCLNE